MYIATTDDIIQIAKAASELKTCSVTDSTGYYLIWESDENEIAIDISKTIDESDGSKCYAVYVDYLVEHESDWRYTNTLKDGELVSLITDIIQDQKDNEEVAMI